MWEHLWEYLVVFALSSTKFIGGPIVGATRGLNIFFTGLFTSLGAMASVVIFTFVGDKFRAYQKAKKLRKNKGIKFNKRRKKVIAIYNKFGIKGIAFITPLFLTPIGGTILALSLGVPKGKIIKTMTLYVFFWGYTLSTIVILFWDKLEPYLKK